MSLKSFALPHVSLPLLAVPVLATYLVYALSYSAPGASSHPLVGRIVLRLQLYGIDLCHTLFFLSTPAPCN